MKKILVSILGILIGFVGFSFASYDFQFNAYSGFQLLDNGSFTTIFGYNPDGNYLATGFPFSFFLSGFNGSVYLDSIIYSYSGIPSYGKGIICSGFDIDGVQSGGYTFIDFGGVDLSQYGYKLENCLNKGGNNRIFSVVLSVNSNSLNIFNKPILLDSDKHFYIYMSGGYYNSNSALIYPIINFHVDDSSIFTVNYGNQSKEYTMTEDIDIFINSPVFKNGSTYMYNGSTGINLFYNNTNIFYDKNKLFLVGQFRYNKNVFTPICL